MLDEDKKAKLSKRTGCVACKELTLEFSKKYGFSSKKDINIF